MIQIELILDEMSGKPMYEQIEEQICESIVCGRLSQGEALPSIRALAKEMKIGIITAQRAYDELSRKGFIYSVAGKGMFVCPIDKEKVKAQKAEQIEKKYLELERFAWQSGFSEEETKNILLNPE